MSLTRDLVRLIRAKPISDEDRRHAALFTLDAVANALAGRKSEPGRLLRLWAATQGEDAGREALLIGGLIHILETDDLHRASVVHPGCVVVPAVLAIGRRQGQGGRALLDAVLHGFEACCRVGMAVGPAHYRVWHNTATCGPYGSAMAAVTLMELDEDQAVHALGNAGTQSGGLWEFLDTGAMSKHLHAGRAAEAGVVAAELASYGFTGAPAILEGGRGFFAGACPDSDPTRVLADPDARWQVHETSIKPWPSCRHTHPTIDAALEIHAELNGASIEHIDVATYAAALDVCDRPLPASVYEAKFSLYHCVAVALADGAVDFDSFDEAARERLAPLCGRTKVAADEPFVSAYPAAWGARVSVTATDGREITVERAACKGDPERALDSTAMEEKAQRLLAFAGMEEAEARSVIDGILGLADIGFLPDLEFI